MQEGEAGVAEGRKGNSEEEKDRAGAAAGGQGGQVTVPEQELTVNTESADKPTIFIHVF